MTNNNVWFVADTHIGHKNIMKHCPKRIELSGAKDENDIEAHDKWIIELWNKTVKKNDDVYIIGDFSFLPSEDTKKLLGKLNGHKFLIVGNHDGSSEGLDNYFMQKTQIKEKTFKQHNFDFLNETFRMYMCHFPLLSWPSKNHGAIMVHGHCHGNIDELNANSNDLRIDVGLDGKLANYNFVSLEQLYNAMMEKIKNSNLSTDTDVWKNSFREYADYIFNVKKEGVI